MEKWIATIIGSIGFLLSYAIDGMGLAIVVLIGVMAIDYATGLMAAWHNKELSSQKGTRGFIRKLYVLLLIGAVAIAESLVFGSEHAADGVAIAYIAVELISITENGVKMDAPMPPVVKRLLDIVKSKTESSE